MLHNIQTIETSQFIVRRDGHLDEDWLEDTLAAQAREKRREMAHMAIAAVGSHSLQLMKSVGNAVCLAIEECVQS